VADRRRVLAAHHHSCVQPRKEHPMAEERDLTHEALAGRQDAGVSETAARAREGMAPGTYPGEELVYWQETYTSEPYYEQGRLYEDYSPAYELGWLGYHRYGGDVDVAERALANDWEMRKGVSDLSWEQARPATRAAWQRAHNAREFASDGSASRDQVIETLNDLLENSRDGELGFKEAAQHSRTPELKGLLERRADSCRAAAGELQAQIARLGGKPDERGTVSGAAHRVWLNIRSLFGGASDATILSECERGEDAAVARYRKALKQNLPADIHALVLRQFEGAQRNHDMIKALRDRAAAPTAE
jgi:uncharacterized protein (TIGR02284 family)